jgi:hypothetical protein
VEGYHQTPFVNDLEREECAGKKVLVGYKLRPSTTDGNGRNSPLSS